MAAFDHLKHLYEFELYDSVSELACIMLTISERCPDFLSLVLKYQTIVYYGDALYQLGNYKKAEQVYMRALHVRRQFIQDSGGGGSHSGTRRSQSTPTAVSEVEVKYRLYQCLHHQRKYQEAIGLLESIVASSRPPKVHNALAGLYRQLGMEKPAVDGYKELLKQCPSALVALRELLSLGYSMSDINKSLLANSGLDSTPYMDWLWPWLTAFQALSSRDYATAVRIFKELDAASNISNNVTVLCHLGKAYCYAGENSLAIAALQRVHSLDPLHLEGVDMLASLLCEEGLVKELESLANRLMQAFDLHHPHPLPHPQPWIVLGYWCKASGKLSRALYFAHKACEIGLRASEDALLLKAGVLMDSGKLVEATLHFKEAWEIAPHRFEVYQGLVNVYTARSETRQAETSAFCCVQKLGKSSARAVALYASVLAKYPSSMEKAQTLLEKVVNSAPHLLSAVYELVHIYTKRGNYDKAIELLRRQSELHVKSKVHKLLGDLLLKVNQGTEALDRYRYALTLDPDNAELRRGMNELEDELRLGSMLCADDDLAAGLDGLNSSSAGPSISGTPDNFAALERSALGLAPARPRVRSLATNTGAGEGDSPAIHTAPPDAWMDETFDWEEPS